MAVSKNLKKAAIEKVGSILHAHSFCIITRNKGLSVAEVTDLRIKVRQGYGGYLVVKNRLVKIALSGTSFEQLDEILTGPTALNYSNDPIALSKALIDFSKDNKKLEVCGGVLDGKLLSDKDIKSLASMPSIDELRVQLLGLLNASATRLVRLLNEPDSRLVRLLSVYLNK